MLQVKPRKTCTKHINTVICYFSISSYGILHLKPGSLSLGTVFNSLIEHCVSNACSAFTTLTAFTYKPSACSTGHYHICRLVKLNGLQLAQHTLRKTDLNRLNQQTLKIHLLLIKIGLLCTLQANRTKIKHQNLKNAKFLICDSATTQYLHLYGTEDIAQ